MRNVLSVLSQCVFLLLLFSCKEKQSEAFKYPTRDYRTVKLFLDTLNAQLQAQMDSTGSYSIPYTDITSGKKHLIFFGASHTRNSEHPQFAQLTKAFENMNPEIAFNEGGQIKEDHKYATADSAIISNGETGLLKYLCDGIGIKMMDGDMDDKQEFAALQQEIPKDKIYLYMAVERYLNGYKQGHFPGMTLEEGWTKKFIPYLVRSEFNLTTEEQSFDYLKTIYKQYLHRDFSLDSLVEIQEYYLIDDGVFGDVGRATKTVRDQALLKKIDKAFEQYDRVFVVFGGSHRIALEPALQEIMNKER